jgi:phenylacetate-CoA ligase
MPIEDIIHPLLKYYTASPQWVKTTLGGAYAALPSSWRYGAEYDRFMNDIDASNDVDELNRRADIKLRQTLSWAASTVPAYAGLKDVVASAHSGAQMLAAFPLLQKETIKADTSRFLSTSMGPETHLLTHTGGSTSIPMKLYLHKYVSRSKDFAYNGTFDAIAGIGSADVILALRGRSVPGAEKSGGPIWMFDPIKRYLHLSSDHLEPQHMPRYVEVMRQWKPTFIHAFPSAIVPLAHWLRAHPEPDITARFKCIQLFSENVYDYQVDLLRQVFGCPVLLDYGASERVIKAISMPGDPRYFFWPLYGKLELVDFAGQSISEPGVLGEIVATGFDNKVMPMVRYCTGDLAMWSDSPNTTRDGFPVVDRIEGRLQEFLVCKDHRLVSIATIGAAHFEQLASADRMQFEQTEVGKATLKVLTPVPLTEKVRMSLARGIHVKTQGGLDIDVVAVQELARTVSGKHKLLVQKLDISSYLGATHVTSESVS